MFYFFFENRAADPKAPLVLWMTGTARVIGYDGSVQRSPSILSRTVMSLRKQQLAKPCFGVKSSFIWSDTARRGSNSVARQMDCQHCHMLVQVVLDAAQSWQSFMVGC